MVLIMSVFYMVNCQIDKICALIIKMLDKVRKYGIIEIVSATIYCIKYIVTYTNQFLRRKIKWQILILQNTASQVP